MLKLIQGLARCEQEKFYGWRLGMAQIDITGKAEQVSTCLGKSKCTCQILGVEGKNSEGIVCQRLQCMLCPPVPDKEVGETAKASMEWQNLPRIVSHAFSREEIWRYTVQSGDTNPIHQGTHPMVPGLCMAWYLQRVLAISSLHWKVSFHAPVYAGDVWTIVQDARQMVGYVDRKRVCTIRSIKK